MILSLSFPKCHCNHVAVQIESQNAPKLMRIFRTLDMLPCKPHEPLLFNSLTVVFFQKIVPRPLVNSYGVVRMTSDPDQFCLVF
jgi:hypothetical protein